MRINKSLLIKLIAGMSVLCFAFAIGMLFTAAEHASAAGSGITVESVDYSNSTVVFDITGEDTGLYISDAKQKKWEYIPIIKDVDGKVKLDFSWIPASKDYTLSVKGNVSTEPFRIVFPKQETKFKATYSIETGEITFTNDNGRPVQWRKKNGYHWEDVSDMAALKERFSTMISNGASLVFRLAPVNGSGTQGGLRPSKEVNITIPKKTAAPKITVNDTLMAIAVTKDTEYRYTDRNGIPTEPENGWKGFEKNENVQLLTIAGRALYSTDNTEPVEQYIQFRTKASKSRQISNNTTVKIPAQEKLTEEEIASFGLEYISASAFTIKAGLASEKQPYEYCIVGKKSVDDGIDLTTPEKLSWKAITSADVITISNTKNAYDNGSMVYIRRKASGSLGEDEYKIASDTYTLSTGLNYPGNATADGTSEFERVVGTCRKENSESHIQFSLYCPGNAVITKLKFGKDDSDSKELGADDFKSVVTENENPQGTDDKYIITTTIYSTKTLESYVTANNNEEITLTGTYCIGNTTEYCDFDGSPLKLTLKAASHIILPGDALKETIASKVSELADIDRIGFTRAINRVYMSNRKYGQNGYTDNADHDIFRALIKLGAKEDTPVTVNQVKYDGVSVMEYVSTYTFDDEDDRYIIIEMDADRIEDMPGITQTDTAVPVYITLNNGEILSELTMKLTSSAKLKDGSTGATFDPSVVKAYKTVSNENGGTTEEPNRDYYIEYRVNISGYEDLLALSATFNGRSVVYDIDSAQGRIYLSIEKIQEYAAQFGATQTGFVEITFSNGFKITKGYRLTLLIN